MFHYLEALIVFHYLEALIVVHCLEALIVGSLLGGFDCGFIGLREKPLTHFESILVIVIC